MIKHLILFISLSLLTHFSHAQLKKNVLFIGNSYTGVNNLPELIKKMALSAGDTLTYDANIPGGQTLKAHSTNQTTLSKIQTGGWDFVVLQEQSQTPAFPEPQVEQDMYPYATLLDSVINANNTCVETVFYMTWGRKNGDAQNCPFFTPLCTYQGMDSLIQERYRYMAEQNNAIIAAAGPVWKYLRENHPSIELYSSDESHPSLAGSYAAACAFYTAIFKKDPTAISFNSTLNAADAETIRNAAKTVVFDQQDTWLLNDYAPEANFTYTIQNGQITFTNTSTFSDSYVWSFGDGNTSILANPTHIFASTGTYHVQLTSTKCSGEMDTTVQTVLINALSTSVLNAKPTFIVFPNPAQDFISISSNQPFNPSYQILNSNGSLILKGELNLDAKTIDIRSLYPGIYFIEFKNHAMQRVPFIKN